MATPPTLDFDALLAPISEAEPCGPGLRNDPATRPIYQAVYDARKAASAAERAASMTGDDAEDRSAAGAPDWRAVVRLASDALSTKSKDLWLAAWLIEGQAREHGFAGLRDGFRLVRELCERYFESLHPRPDEDDDITMTLSQLAGLNGEGTADGVLLGAIAAIPITEGRTVGPFTGHDYADAESVAKTADPDARARRIEQGAATLEIFDTAARETSPEFFAALREDIEGTIDEFDKMNAVLGEKSGNDRNGFPASPPSTRISTALADALTRVKSLAGEPQETPSEEGSSEEAAAGGTRVASGSISSREDAFKTLMKVAEFFRRTEPHSPVSYALEQAVRWGRMQLPDLIRDLVSDDTVRREFFRRTGIQNDSNND
jgi:type VI secretion system protein ImpA